MLSQNIIKILIFTFLFIIALSFLSHAQEESYTPYGVWAHFERPEFYSAEDIDRACKLTKEAGIQWISTCFNWKDTEPEKGKFDFSLTDKIVEITSSYNLNLLPLLWYCPKWAKSSDLSYILYPPSNVEDYANFAYQLVKRYKNKITYWQIWGEQNTYSNWRPFPNPEGYLELLKATYKKIKEADPDAKIVLGSLALWNLENFLDELYQLGGKKYFDIVAINPYVHPTLNYDAYIDKKGDSIELVKNWIFKVRKIMTKHGDFLKPLWITEIGSPGQEEPGNWWLLGITPTEEEQAEWVKRVYTELLEENLVDKIFWYNFRTPKDEEKARAGLVSIDFRIKPAYLTYKNLPKFKTYQGLNVLLISVDCMRPDHLNCYGYDYPTSPALEKLSEQGIKFTQAISVAPWTSPSLISLITSLYPPVHGVTNREKSLPKGTPTSIKILKNLGYSVPGISYIHTVLNYYNLGFDVVKEPTKFKQKDDEVQIREWLDKNYRKKFFLWHHFYTPHLPYNPLPEYEKLFVKYNEDNLSGELQHKLDIIRSKLVIRKGDLDFKEKDLPYIIPLYDAEIRQVDSQINAVIDKLKELGIFYKTIIIITSDHGEEFLEHGAIGHASTTLTANLYDECIRIPLIIWNPRVLPEGITINEQVQNVDIMPTIFELLDISLDIPTDGVSLVPLITGKTNRLPHEFVFSDTIPGGFQSTEEQRGEKVRSVRTKYWKLIHQYSPDKENYLLFDLKNDHLEKENVADKYPLTKKTLISNLDKWTFHCLTKKKWIRAKSEKKFKTVSKQLLKNIPQPKILLPCDDSNLIFEDEEGKVILKWKGNPVIDYIIEYDIGKGDLNMKGSFLVEGNRQVFKPIPKDIWELLYIYNPWKFRVKVKGKEDLKSKWVNFNFSPK